MTSVVGDGEDFSIQRDELDADFGHSGVAYENQARQIVQQDNIAANATTAWMFRGAETSVVAPDRDALQFDPSPLSGSITNEEPAITGFHSNTAIAVNTAMDSGHRQGINLSTDVRSDIIDFTAWNVNRGIDMFNYTSEYVFKDLLLIGNGTGPALFLGE